MKQGLKQFGIRLILLLIALVSIQLILAGNSSEEFILSNLPKLFIIVDLAAAFMAGLVLVFVMYKDKIKNIEKFKINVKESWIFGILSFLMFILYLIFTKFVMNNLEEFESFTYGFVFLRYLFLIIILFFLMNACLSKQFVKKLFNIKLVYFLVGVIGIYYLIETLHGSWYFFSHIITNSVYFLLDINFNAVVSFMSDIPVVGISSFQVGIAQSCSGISSMFLFAFLYVFAVAYDWKILNHKKAILMFIPGIISVFILNIIRIYLIILIGAFISEEFAVGVFHTGIAGVLFVIYFAIFWGAFYKWMKK
jgi:exosortase/archaeosortase family protein